MKWFINPSLFRNTDMRILIRLHGIALALFNVFNFYTDTDMRIRIRTHGIAISVVTSSHPFFSVQILHVQSTLVKFADCSLHVMYRVWDCGVMCEPCDFFKPEATPVPKAFVQSRAVHVGCNSDSAANVVGHQTSNVYLGSTCK